MANPLAPGFDFLPLPSDPDSVLKKLCLKLIRLTEDISILKDEMNEEIQKYESSKSDDRKHIFNEDETNQIKEYCDEIQSIEMDLPGQSKLSIFSINGFLAGAKMEKYLLLRMRIMFLRIPIMKILMMMRVIWIKPYF